MYSEYIMLLLTGNIICYAERVTGQRINRGTKQPTVVNSLKLDHGPNNYGISQSENKVPFVDASSPINLHIHHSSDRHIKCTKESPKLGNFDKFTNVLPQTKSALEKTDTGTAYYPVRVIKLKKKATSLLKLLSPYKHNRKYVYDNIPRDNDEFPAAQDLPQLNQYTANKDSDMIMGKAEENSSMVNANINIMKAVSHINEHTVLKKTEKVEKAYSEVHDENVPRIYTVKQDSYMHFKGQEEENFQPEKAVKNIIEESQNANSVNSLFLDNTNSNSIFHHDTYPLLMVKVRGHKDNIRVVREAGNDKGESLSFTDLLSSHSTIMNTKSTGTTTEAVYKTTPSGVQTSQQKTTVSHVPSSTSDPPPIPYCHQACLQALNATHMYSNDSLILSQGSDLTLICELPLNTTFYLVNLIWLFQPDNSPEGQCSLSPQEFISSCQGFQTITNTDDRNSSLLRETITLSNVIVNQTGHYMCKVEMTCCPDSQEHIMNQERISHIIIRVWTANYTYDLIMAGSTAAVLIFIVIGVSFCLRQHREDDYITIEKQKKEIMSSAVLHMPLIDDQDNDSFDSNFDEND